MAVDQAGDDRPAPERPKRQWRTARGEAFLPREEWRRGRQGKKTSRPLRMPIELSFSSAVFGQTCPIETAVGEPADRSKGIRQWRHRAVIGWKRLPHAPARSVHKTKTEHSLRRTCGVGPEPFSRRAVELPHGKASTIWPPHLNMHAPQVGSIFQPVSGARIRPDFWLTLRLDIGDVARQGGAFPGWIIVAA
jgi:hypothetical protein